MSENQSLFILDLRRKNSALVQLLALSPMLAVADTLTKAFGLGLATLVVLTCTHFAMSAGRRWIPADLRLPCYFIIITCVVLTVQIMMNAYAYSLYHYLGEYIPLVVANCIVIGRLGTCVPKNLAHYSLKKGLSTSLRATCVLAMIGALRELISHGTLFDGAELLLGGWARILRLSLLQTGTSWLLVSLVPGVLISLGLMQAGWNFFKQKASTISHHE